MRMAVQGHSERHRQAGCGQVVRRMVHVRAVQIFAVSTLKVKSGEVTETALVFAVFKVTSAVLRSTSRFSL